MISQDGAVVILDNTHLIKKISLLLKKNAC